MKNLLKKINHYLKKETTQSICTALLLVIIYKAFGPIMLFSTAIACIMGFAALQRRLSAWVESLPTEDYDQFAKELLYHHKMQDSQEDKVLAHYLMVSRYPADKVSPETRKIIKENLESYLGSAPESVLSQITSGQLDSALSPYLEDYTLKKFIQEISELKSWDTLYVYELLIDSFARTHTYTSIEARNFLNSLSKLSIENLDKVFTSLYESGHYELYDWALHSPKISAGAIHQLKQYTNEMDLVVSKAQKEIAQYEQLPAKFQEDVKAVQDLIQGLSQQEESVIQKNLKIQKRQLEMYMHHK